MDKILVLDFGSQTTQLIARRIRELNVYSEIQPFNYPLEKIKEFAPKGVVLSGGPDRVTEDNVPRVEKGVLELGVPVMGICYGMQEMSRILGGGIDSAKTREYGFAEATVDPKSKLLARTAHDAQRTTQVWMSHNDIVNKTPEKFFIRSHTKDCPIAAMESEDGRFYGTQFHPEVSHTKEGMTIWKNFVIDICGCKPSWTMKSFIDRTISDVKERVGDDHVILGLSGGVDSSVVAVLLSRALGDQLTCIFVDNGLLRKYEAIKVEKMFKDNFHLNVICVDAADRFLKKLKGVTDPEKKRKIIGNEFVAVFEEEAKRMAHGAQRATYLAQGTLYPDVIESVSFKGPSHTIKTHHNVGGLPEKMGLKLIEPLRELFKDEVRALGRELGMGDEVVGRHPFPGPGLAVRVIGEITKENLNLLREADDIFIEEIRKAGWYDKIWQAFCVFLPIKSVGVMGDARTYENVVALRAVSSKDAMTADWSELPYELLGRTSNRIINSVKGISRVVYDVSSKPPSTIEWE